MDKQRWLQAAQKAGLEAFEIYEQKRSATSIRIYDGKVDGYKISECDGISLRGIYEGKQGICFLEDMNDDICEEMIQQVIANAKYITSEDKQEILAPQASYQSIYRKHKEILDTANDKKIEKLKALETAILQMDKRIAQVMEITYGETIVSRDIVNTKGMDLHDEDACAYVVAEVMAKDKDDTKSGYDWMYISSLDELDVEAFAKKVCDKVCGMLHADMIDSGTYPVLIHHDAMTSLFSALSGMFNGESAFKGISILKDKMNQKVFDSSITIIDDALMEDGIASASFDDEGMPCEKTEVVKNGVLTSYLHNSKSAHMMKVSSTGNGFKAGYSGPVSIAPTNLYIEAGVHTYEEMVASMEKGIIVTSITGLHAGLNTVSTEFSLQSSGYYVEHGKIVKPINLFTIAGNFMEMMSNISMLGNDVTMGMSGIGTPSILFKKCAVSGK